MTRGGLHETASDCGLVLLANIQLDHNQMPTTFPLVSELPGFLQETAFLDRIKGIIPGWEIPKLSNDSFAKSLGLKADFFGDALISMREDFIHDQLASQKIKFLGDKVYKRNADAVTAIASGMMKILFPNAELSNVEFERYCVKPAKRLRQLVWDQLQALDSEYRQYASSILVEVID